MAVRAGQPFIAGPSGREPSLVPTPGAAALVGPQAAIDDMNAIYVRRAAGVTRVRRSLLQRRLAAAQRPQPGGGPPAVDPEPAPIPRRGACARGQSYSKCTRPLQV